VPRVVIEQSITLKSLAATKQRLLHRERVEQRMLGATGAAAFGEHQPEIGALGISSIW
jgi:hypothetical protein